MDTRVKKHVQDLKHGEKKPIRKYLEGGPAVGMIDRYKKRGGFVALVNLLETMGLDKRADYLQRITQESASWGAAIKQKMLTVERMSQWNSTFLMEFIPQLPAQYVASAISVLSEDKRKIFITVLSFAAKRQVEDILKDFQPKPGEVATGQIKLINEARLMIAQGKLKIDKCDPEMTIPENIEEKLESPSYFETSTSAEPSTPPAAAASGVHSTAAEELTGLRRKLVAITQENVRLQKEVADYKMKIEGIKAALSKAS